MIEKCKNCACQDCIFEECNCSNFTEKGQAECSDYRVKPCLDYIKENDNVKNPKHYNSHPSGIECIEVTRHMNFNLGNAIKYIWRAGLKSENAIEDLKKAIWYLEDEVKRMEGEQ